MLLATVGVDRDSLVQVIDQVQDICQWEPWQLAESSKLQTGDRLWYFIYSPTYKYRNSKRINRTTREGYWKPTGNPRKIIDTKTGKVIGTKRTLVYYKGQCNDKFKIRTCWVMHEYELVAAPNSIDTDQKTFILCKLKKRVDISCTDAGQSSQHKDCDDVVYNQSGIESYAGERSNQHNIANDDVVSNLSSHDLDDAIPKLISLIQENLHERSKECNEPEGNSGVQKLNSIIEKDDKSCSSVLTNGDETITVERNNQHNVVVPAKGFGIPWSFEYLPDEFLIPADFFDNDGLSFDELLEVPEATNNSNWIQDQSITSIEDVEFLNSIFVDNDEAYLLEENRPHPSAADNEVLGAVGSSDSMEKPSKRLRLSHDDHVETTEAGAGGSISPTSSSKEQEMLKCY
ncbi:NAC domain-containing protein 83-like [Gossypium australe]|uniref:NAC domain-containing protein 83-like n=1 Tax=Gossypium australe TaxID=47621 RepID=A0A5B6UMH7_9ROSI|nr:NAC domain-containing protein 83-like [Gossypium australe]